jgi:hypothetical protein
MNKKKKQQQQINKQNLHAVITQLYSTKKQAIKKKINRHIHTSPYLFLYKINSTEFIYENLSILDKCVQMLHEFLDELLLLKNIYKFSFYI